MNSIIDNISKEDIIAEIKLLLDSDIKHEKIVVVVEGLDDERFLNSMCFDKEKTLFMQSYSGKLGVIDILSDYNDENRVIAIIDKDYSNNSESNRIFYYDYCCLEMMLISNKENFENLYNEYIYPSQMDSETTKIYILNQLKYISLLRKMNEEKKLGINFCKVKINTVYDNALDIEKYKQLFDQRNNNILKGNLELEKELEIEYRKELNMEQLLNITNGHDFCDTFALISRKHKRKGISKEIIQSAIRCTYRKEDFAETKLFNNLKTYEKVEKISILTM